MRILKKNIEINKTILSNFSYLAILEIFFLFAPLITYPYLVRTLGMDLYGWVITAQITVSYATVLIDFGFRRISAKYVASVKSDIIELSKVVSTVIALRVMLCIITFLIYLGVIYIIPSYRSQWMLFLFSYGLTLGSALFPDFYFQGIENMRYITVINIISRLIFICSTFLIIKHSTQYVYVPLLWSAGYILGGISSLYIVFKKHKVKFIIPSLKDYKFHLKVTTPIFLSDVMLNLKNKFNYNLMGVMLGTSDVVIYDVGTKIVNLLAKPTQIFSSVIFPSMSRNPNVKKTKQIMLGLIVISIFMVAIVYVFLPYIIKLFINEAIDIL
ncbi:MAG: oligosaccharide flippase family protein, partial [Muribaculaceae bacterium]|nr:oligosaccharide flippase family protein [Muribaculaceae bacterium]